VAGFNAAVMSVTIDGCLFRGNRTDAINIDAANTASVTSAVRNNFILGGSGGSNQGNLGINLTSGASGVHTTTVSNNRVGTDGNGIAYAGDSVALDPLGQPLVEGDAAVRVLEARFSAEQLRGHRERFPAHRDADDFELR